MEADPLTGKPVVRCRMWPQLPELVVGNCAFISTIDHPHLSNNGGMVRTSPVKAKFDGGFETRNTIYNIVD